MREGRTTWGHTVVADDESYVSLVEVYNADVPGLPTLCVLLEITSDRDGQEASVEVTRT